VWGLVLSAHRISSSCARPIPRIPGGDRAAVRLCVHPVRVLRPEPEQLHVGTAAGACVGPGLAMHSRTTEPLPTTIPRPSPPPRSLRTTPIRTHPRAQPPLNRRRCLSPGLAVQITNAGGGALRTRSPDIGKWRGGMDRGMGDGGGCGEGVGLWEKWVDGGWGSGWLGGWSLRPLGCLNVVS